MKKNKFFLCLRPVVSETADGKPKIGEPSLLKRGRDRNARQLKSNGSEEMDKFLDRSEHKLENPKSGELDSNKTSSSLMCVKTQHPGEASPTIYESHQSPCSSSSSSSSVHDPKSLSRTGSFYNSLNTDKKQKTKVNGGGPDFNSGMYLIVISLFVTMFWGKVFGILCTSIWFYFVHRRSDRDRRLKNMASSPEN